MKRTKLKTAYPKDMKEAKEICRKLCKEHKLKISFDDKWKNFTHREYNSAALGDNYVQCSKFRDWNYDLLIFAVMHEIGHSVWINNEIGRKKQKLEIFPFYTEMKNGFAREFEAWNYAIELFNSTFRRNISIKQARYMMDCLNSYIPDYNDFTETKIGISENESSFWCPMKKRVIK